jgi:hypothetical protein
MGRLLLLAILLCEVAYHLRLGGTSPILWTDTVFEEHEVQSCLRQSHCSALGTSASIEGIAFANGWLMLRDFLGSLGIGTDGTHVLIQLLRAVEALLLAVAAFRLSGRTATALVLLFGSTAAGLAWHVTLPLFPDGTLQPALYNVVLLPFLGALLVLLGVLIREGEGAPAVVLAALVAAIAANVHVAAASAGVSVVLLGLAAPRRRFALAALALVVFAGAAYSISPATWQHDLREITQHLHGQSIPRKLGGGTADRSPVLGALAIVGLGWLASLAWKGVKAQRLRSGMTVALLLAGPPLVATWVAGSRGLASYEARYFSHAVPAVIFAAALLLGSILSALASFCVRRFDTLATPLERVARLLPYLALVLLLVRVRHADYFNDEPRVAGAEQAARQLRDGHRWTWPMVFGQLHTPEGRLPMELLEQLIPWPIEARTTDDAAYLLTVDRSLLPDTLPPSWTRFNMNSTGAAVLAMTHSGLDWKHFELCWKDWSGRDSCQPCGLIPNPAGSDTQAILPCWPDRPYPEITARVPWTPRPGSDERIIMPRSKRWSLCSGDVARVPDGSSLTDEGLGARLKGTAAGTVELRWRPGSAACPVENYSAFPPLVLAGETRTVELLAQVIASSRRNP